MPTFNEEEVKQQALDLANQLNQGVDTAYSAGLANMQQQQALLPQEYNPYRDSARLQNRIDTKTLNEQMANIGLTQSGTNLTAQTALKTSNQKTMNSINSAEQKALRELTAQINQYIGERDAAKQTNLANSMGRAQDTINSYKSNESIAQLQQQFQKENMALEQQYNIESANLSAQLQEAAAQNDFARQSSLQKEMAALNNSYDIQQANLAQQFNVQNSATQQGYNIQNANLEQKFYKENQATAQKYDVANAKTAFNNSMTAQQAQNTYDRETDAINNQLAMAKEKRDIKAEKELYAYKSSLDYGYTAKLNALKSSGVGASEQSSLSAADQKAITAYAKGFKTSDKHKTATAMFNKYASVDSKGNITITPAYELAMSTAGLSSWLDDTTVKSLAIIKKGGSAGNAANSGLSYRNLLTNGKQYNVDDNGNITTKLTGLTSTYKPQWAIARLKAAYKNNNDFYQLAMESAGLSQYL